MKSLFILLAAFSSLFAAAKTTYPSGSRAAQLSFTSAFSTASDVVWSYTNDVYKAGFLLNGQYATAFYDTEGNFMAVTRNISSLQLPLTLQAALKTEYKQMWISDLFEITTEGGVNYFVTLENADTKIVLKASGNAGWSLFQKVRKS